MRINPVGVLCKLLGTHMCLTNVAFCLTEATNGKVGALRQQTPGHREVCAGGLDHVKREVESCTSLKPKKAGKQTSKGVEKNYTLICTTASA